MMQWIGGVPAGPVAPTAFLVAPDSFKGTLTALDVAEAIAAGLVDAGRPVDLPEFARRARESLLIKPNVGSSGFGLLLGREAGATRWEARIARALREPGRWVVQARHPGTRRPVVYLRNGRAHAGPCYFSLGLFYAPNDLGLHVRVSREPVVNVARQGAVACAFLTP